MSVDLQSWVQISELARNLGLVLGGGIGVYIAWKRVSAATRQADAQIRQAEAQIRQAHTQIGQASLARRDHVAELFNRAVGQLKVEKLEVRLGAIFTLRQICRDFRDLSEPAIQLLTTYLQENMVDYGDMEMPVDVREIARIVRDDRLEDTK